MKRSQSSTIDQSTSTSKTPKLDGEMSDMLQVALNEQHISEIKQEISKLKQEGSKLTDLQQQLRDKKDKEKQLREEQLREEVKQLREKEKQLRDEEKQLRDEKRLSNTYYFRYQNATPYEHSFHNTI